MWLRILPLLSGLCWIVPAAAEGQWFKPFERLSAPLVTPCYLILLRILFF